MLKPIEAIVFDYGGVFSTPLFRGIGRFESDMGYPPGSVLELLFGEAAYIGVEGRSLVVDDADGATTTVERVPEAAHAVTHDWHRLEVGDLTLEEYFKGVVERAPEVLGKPIDFDAYRRFSAEMPIGVHWPVVHRARELRDDGLRLALLTNNVKEWGDHWRATFPIDELFDVVVDSSEVGMRKPDPRVYELTCERVGVPTSAAVFVDDNTENVAAARRLGMEVVLFGDDAWAALAELDAILERRGTLAAG
jgi:epoxide hydrolase-like predicted phosphatase